MTGSHDPAPTVAVVTGRDSGWLVPANAAAALDGFGASYQVKAASLTAEAQTEFDSDPPDVPRADLDDGPARFDAASHPCERVAFVPYASRAIYDHGQCLAFRSPMRPRL